MNNPDKCLSKPVYWFDYSFLLFTKNYSLNFNCATMIFSNSTFQEKENLNNFSFIFLILMYTVFFFFNYSYFDFISVYLMLKLLRLSVKH